MAEVLVPRIDEIGIAVNKPDVNLVFLEHPDQRFCGDGEEHIVCIKLENIFAPTGSYSRIRGV